MQKLWEVVGMTFEELKKWDEMLLRLKSKDLESVIMLAVAELQSRAEVYEEGVNHEN